MTNQLQQPPHLSTLARAIPRKDYFRRSPFSVGGRSGHKEWHHFCILGPQLELLVNFSLSDDVRRGAVPGAELARLTLLVRAQTWDGDVDTFTRDAVRVAGGRIDVRFGPNTLRFHDGAYHIAVALQDRPVTAAITLRPLTMPSPAPNIPLPDGPPLHWVIVPRLLATGHVEIARRRYEFHDVLAYHDHNWGHFLWGHAFSWVWGFSLPLNPATPWSLVFVRLANRARTQALAQGMFLWKDAGKHRLFRDHDVEMRFDIAHLRPQRVFKIPRVMALLHPDASTDVPCRVEMRAQGEGDWLLAQFDATDLAQVVIPSETDLGVTVINEVTGRLNLEGSIRGERITVAGRAVCEFLGS